jgi:hypothetical protein
MIRELTANMQACQYEYGFTAWLAIAQFLSKAFKLLSLTSFEIATVQVLKSDTLTATGRLTGSTTHPV